MNEIHAALTWTAVHLGGPLLQGVSIAAESIYLPAGLGILLLFTGNWSVWCIHYTRTGARLVLRDVLLTLLGPLLVVDLLAMLAFVVQIRRIEWTPLGKLWLDFGPLAGVIFFVLLLVLFLVMKRPKSSSG